MKRVSFDFDGTLDIDVVATYAKELVERGVEVWVTTSRMDNTQGSPNENDDLFDLTSKCKISLTNVHFTNGGWKAAYMEKIDCDFTWHLDNDWLEITRITALNIPMKGITNFGNPDWKVQCEELLNFDEVDI